MFVGAWPWPAISENLVSLRLPLRPSASPTVFIDITTGHYDLVRRRQHSIPHRYGYVVVEFFFRRGHDGSVSSLHEW